MKKQSPGESPAQIITEYHQLVRMVKSYVQYCRNVGIDGIHIQNSERLFTSVHHPDFTSFNDLQNYLIQCQKCPLSKNQMTAVPGEGNLNPVLVFIGKSPGQEESVQGKPFLGEAGNLLTRILSSINLSREDVYLTYAIKCPCPEGKNLSPEDTISVQQATSTCPKLLFRELQFLRPRLICTLGTEATHMVLEKQGALSDLRGNIFSRNIGERSVKIIPTFSLDHLIENELDKKLAWLDMKLILKEYKRKV